MGEDRASSAEKATEKRRGSTHEDEAGERGEVRNEGGFQYVEISGISAQRCKKCGIIGEVGKEKKEKAVGDDQKQTAGRGPASCLFCTKRAFMIVMYLLVIVQFPFCVSIGLIK